MEITTTIDGACATVAVAGKLTVATAPELEAVLNDLPADVKDIAIDMTELDYIASAGLRVIVAGEKRIRRKEGALLLQHPNDDVMEVLEMTGLCEVLNIER